MGLEPKDDYVQGKRATDDERGYVKSSVWDVRASVAGEVGSHLTERFRGVSCFEWVEEPGEGLVGALI